MTRRIVGQCSTADFRYLEHLSGVLKRGDEVDLTNLTNRQKMAVSVLHHFQNNDVSFKVLLKIKEVLVWDLNPGIAFEYKVLDPYDRETMSILRRM